MKGYDRSGCCGRNRGLTEWAHTCQRWSKLPGVDANNEAPDCTIPRGYILDIRWQIYYDGFLSFWFALTGIDMYSGCGFACLVSRALTSPYISKLMEHWICWHGIPYIISDQGAHLSQGYCGSGPISTRSNISVTYCTTQKTLACWRHIWHRRSMEIFVKNGIHHPECIICIEKYIYFALFLQRKNILVQEVRHGDKSYYHL